MSNIQLWRYSLPSVNHSGWAIFVLGSDGYFSAVSDFGNYAFLWRAHGCSDFREFLLRAERDSDYFIGKLSPGEVYDGDETMKEIKKGLQEALESKEITREAMEQELRTIEDEYCIESDEEAFNVWASETKLLDPHTVYGFRCERHPSDVQRFVKEAMVRLQPLLVADLEKEKTNAGG